MKQIKNADKLLLSEVLSMINEDVTLINPGQPFAYQKNSALHQVFFYGYVPQARFKLPAGDPPYTPNQMQAGTNPVDLLIAIRRGQFHNFHDNNIPAPRREAIFIRLLETVNIDEAKVLLAVKDQKLDQLYPNITYSVLYKAGYVPYDELRCNQSNTKSEPTEEEIAAEGANPLAQVQKEDNANPTSTKPAKRGRGRPRRVRPGQ